MCRCFTGGEYCNESDLIIFLKKSVTGIGPNMRAIVNRSRVVLHSYINSCMILGKTKQTELFASLLMVIEAQAYPQLAAWPHHAVRQLGPGRRLIMVMSHWLLIQMLGLCSNTSSLWSVRTAREGIGLLGPGPSRLPNWHRALPLTLILIMFRI